MAAAPLLVDDTVVVHPGGPDGKSVVAYNKRTGARVWSSQNDAAGYASPILATIRGVRQIVVFSATRLMGLKPEDGSLPLGLSLAHAGGHQRVAAVVDWR
jgi:glucose dehydrogenase